MGQVGRPLKYRAVFKAMEDDVVYSPASAVRNAIELGCLEVPEGTELPDLKRKIRHTLSRFRKSHQFPEDGDAYVKVDGQTPTQGWYGWRWKAAAAKSEYTTQKPM